MSENIIIITPHPDDETLGCGGSILRHIQAGDNVIWLIVTTMNESYYSEKRVINREAEIQKVKKCYGFSKVIQLPFYATELSDDMKGQLISSIREIFEKHQPNVVYVPYRNDIHSDHKIVFDATIACTKWFRNPSVEKVLVYETLSETDFSIDPDSRGFKPNVFINIEDFIDKKIEIMKIYDSELGEHPFPRSEKSIRALATLRGAAAGVEAAEAFMLLKERVL